MPKTYNKYPYNVSAAISVKLKKLLNEETKISQRPISEIIREALFEYFGEEEEEEEEDTEITISIKPHEIAQLKQLGILPS